MRRVVFASLLAFSGLCAAAPADEVLEEVVVTATFRRQSLLEVPVSITVLDQQRLRDRGQQHFEDVLAGVPNLHWASGTSRPRYFQIRGIGEREQYEGAPNPSVGFLIDDIDFSGIGMPATLFDVDRIEVLRGPQGMRYGANALAGLIVMRGRDPGQEFGATTEASFGGYDTPLARRGGRPDRSRRSIRPGGCPCRVSVDGFRDDVYLGRDDTNDRDELTARAKWSWRPGTDTSVDLTWLHADLDNGYDGWSIDNTRRSLADRPGKDAQEADGASVRVETRAGSVGTLTVIAAARNRTASTASTATGAMPRVGPLHVRLLLQGAQQSQYAQHRGASRVRGGGRRWPAGLGRGGLRAAHGREHRRTQRRRIRRSILPAVLGIDRRPIAQRLRRGKRRPVRATRGPVQRALGMVVRLRGEQRTADYRDSGVQDGAPRVTDTGERDRMWGGQATVFFDPRDNLRWFATLSRGYRPVASISARPQRCARAFCPSTS